MQQLKYLGLMGLFIVTGAHALTVQEGDIAGKSSLVAVAQVSVKGRSEAILVDSAGLSLYTFEMDSAGVSACDRDCLVEWPPLHVPAGAAVASPFGTITGNDGQTQLTLEGLPLYHYDDDKRPGDTFGEYPSWDVILVNK
jgi:predicted lipoprotein with Yx(FWY)xxD motif